MRLHIAIANQWYPPESGWGEVAMYNHEIAHACRQLGHDVTVIARRTKAKTPAYSEIDGIRIHRLLTRDRYYLRRAPVVGSYSRPVQQLTYSWRLRKLLKSIHRAQPIDVVEFAEINAEGFFFARKPWIPFVVRCHTPTFVLQDFFNEVALSYDTEIVSKCEKYVIRHAHELTAPSKDMAQRIAKATGIDRDWISVIPNPLSSFGVSANGFGSAPAKPLTVLYVGRIERAKGITILATAITKVVALVPDTSFVIAGYDRPTSRGTSRQRELEEQFTRAGIGARVEFAGAVDQSQLAALYARADVCVAPALQYESFSYTCAQAMAAGKPVVATRVGGVPETVDDDVTGIIVTPGDADQLTAAIVRLLKDKTARAMMGRAGREKVLREYEPLKVAQRNLAVYDQAHRTFLENPR